MQRTEKYKVINTKVSPEAFEKIYRLSGKMGIKPYEILQMCVDTLIRYMDDRHNLSPEMEKIIAVFEDMTGWHRSFNLADPTGKPEIGEATYYLRRNGKQGTRAIHVEHPFFGDFRQTANVTQILDRTIENLSPNLYRRLRSLCVEMDCGSVMDLLQTMVDARVVEDLNHESVRQMFEDCNRAENGKPVAYGERTRRKKRYTPDTMPEQRLFEGGADTFDIDSDAIGI